jgi:hypothetical protein
MNELTPIRPGSMPAHLASARLNLNAAAHANLVAGGFPVLSFKGKSWSVKHHGDWELLQGSAGVDHHGRPLPKQPLQYIDVVIVGNATNLSKSYYEKSFSQGDDNVPDCFSVDAIAPDPGAKHKQHTSCKVCPKNQWGSRITDAGKKAKACQDYRRIAVVPFPDVSGEVYGGPILLRIPPMSLLSLDKYATHVERVAGADISQVVTRISFDPAFAYPSLQFEAIGWIDDAAMYAQVIEHAESSQVKRMLHDAIEQQQGGSGNDEPARAQLGPRPAHLAHWVSPAHASSPQAWADAVQKEHQHQLAQSAVNPVPAPDPAPAPVQMAPPPPPPAPAPAPAPAPKAPTQAAKVAAPPAPAVIQGAPDDLEEAVDDLLGGN